MPPFFVLLPEDDRQARRSSKAARRDAAGAVEGQACGQAGFARPNLGVAAPVTEIHLPGSLMEVNYITANSTRFVQTIPDGHVIHSQGCRPRLLGSGVF